MELPTALSPLKQRSFRIYWLGQAVSLTGTWMQMMAQGWVVTDLTTDALVLGLLNAAGAAPILLLSLKGGQLADRVEKRRILLATQIAMMVLAFVFAGLMFSGGIRLWHVFVMASLLGVATAFDLPAAQSFPPELVERADIGSAVGLMQSIFHGSRLVGPAVAGVLIARFGRGSAFLANGLSFLAVIASLIAIKPKAGAAAPPRPRGGAAIGEGFAYVRKDQLLRSLISLTALTTGSVFPFLAVLTVYYVRYALGTDDARVLGIVMSTSGVGSLIGAAAILSGSPATRRRWLLLAVCGASAGLTGMSLARALPVVVPFALLLAFSVSSLMGRVSQMVQERVPGELRGRVMGIYSISFTGIMPVTTLFWSFLVDRLGHGEGYPRVMRLAAGIFFVLGLLTLRNAWSALAPRPPGAHEPEASGAA